ncbi:MAG: hypothetical protein ACK5G9_14045 [Akkermansiaceae bacterium]|jgi:hypothetical protein
MSERSKNSQEHAFNCPSCHGRIVIPFNLPPTAGPCPHCQATVTSPDFLVNTSAIEVEVDTSVVETPTPTPTPAPATAPATATPNQAAKKGNSIVRILVFLLIIGGLGGAAYFVIGILRAKNETNEPLGIKLFPRNSTEPAKAIINPTMEKYLAAYSLNEKMDYVLNAELLRPKIEAFYTNRTIDETNTPANKFSTVQIPEADSNKGFTLLQYNHPESTNATNLSNSNTKVLAFLKETEQGVKLDWEVFAQTKYKTFNAFIKNPIIAKTEVFRMIVTNEPATNPPNTPANDTSYKFTDPIHKDDSAQIYVLTTTQAGQALSSLDQESAKTNVPTHRTATVELIWAGTPEKPQLQVNRFICWEFLNLGGKEIAEIPPSK